MRLWLLACVFICLAAPVAAQQPPVLIPVNTAPLVSWELNPDTCDGACVATGSTVLVDGLPKASVPVVAGQTAYQFALTPLSSGDHIIGIQTFNNGGTAVPVEVLVRVTPQPPKPAINPKVQVVSTVTIAMPDGRVASVTVASPTVDLPFAQGPAVQ